MVFPGLPIVTLLSLLLFTICSAVVICISMLRAHDPRPPLRGGGIMRSPVLEMLSLAPFDMVSSSAVLPKDGSATITGFVRKTSASMPSKAGYVVVVFDLPLLFLVDRLPFRLLVELCRFHRVRVGRSHRSIPGVVSLLRAHSCDVGCDVLTVLDLPLPVVAPRSRVQCQVLARFPPALGSFPSVDMEAEFIRVGPLAEIQAAVHSTSTYIACFIPFTDLLVHLRYDDFMSVLPFHGLSVPSRRLRPDELVRLVLDHRCSASSCDALYTLFGLPGHCTPSPPQSPGLLPPADFPPSVVSTEKMARTVREWCESYAPSSIAEAPCSICARLTLARSLRSLDRDDIDLSPLHRPGANITRMPRYDASVPPSEIIGPILFPHQPHAITPMLSVCPDCLRALEKHRLPSHALANGLWLGDVPPVLAELNFVEKLLVALGRHNVCVVRVKRGRQKKMNANAVIFPQPLSRFYSILPPPREDLDQCLSILFVGSCLPTGKDYRRTPFLVRHNVVLRALNWLILNHSEYRDVTISQDNLAQYPENEPPVQVIRRDPDVGDDSDDAPPESIPVNGPREQFPSTEATSAVDDDNSPCSFAVHGLTGTQYVSMTYDEKVALAVKHFTSGGSVLAYGHSADPSSIYNDPKLFPRLFPWLYPYGLGGFANAGIKTTLSRIAHIRFCLTYHDRRFQTDDYFPFIAFNHEQIRASATGGYLLTTRRNFPAVAENLLNLDRAALQRLIDRGRDGHSVSPQTPEESACMSLLTVLDHVGGQVPGSTTQKKYQRNEIKSLIICYNVPLFFITFSPVDFKNPLCLYYCGESIDLLTGSGVFPSAGHRLASIADNPVACAKFFHHVVSTFLSTVIKAGEVGKDCGLFGPASTYYGTVEEQGRLTLHLHLLLWIKDSPSPQVIRDRLLSEPVFRDQLIAWLESCHKGEYTLSSEAEIRRSLAEQRRGKSPPEADDEDADEDADCFGYRDPTSLLPTPPPPNVDSQGLLDWYRAACKDTDEIVYLSNRHDSEHSKGCLRGKPPAQYCRARFPRELRPVTMVDPDTGALRFKQMDPWINTYNIVISLLIRANTDVSCLLSGTQVRAVIAYVTDYITKVQLKTYSVFEAVKSVLDKSDAILQENPSRSDAARKMLTKIVNALTGMREIGGPAACTHLLGLPDHYTNHRFKVFFWYNYIQHVRRDFPPDSQNADVDIDAERVLVGLERNKVVPMNKINDYVFRPEYFEKWSLYDYLRATDVYKMAKKKASVSEDHSDSASDDSSDSEPEDRVPCSRSHRFLRGHPQRASHVVRMVPDSDHYVLNFVGGTLPRIDRGELDDYHRAMLVFFRPGGWRSGRDLLQNFTNWADAFTACPFSDESLRVMKNMNVLYECLDARDDFSAARRAGTVPEFPVELGRLAQTTGDPAELLEESVSSAYVDTERDLLALLEDPAYMADKVTVKKTKEMESMRELLARASYHAVNPSFMPPLLVPTAITRHDPAFWKDGLQRARQAALSARTQPDIPESVPVEAGSFSPRTNDSFPSSRASRARNRMDVVAVVTLNTLRDICPGFIDTPLQDSAIQTLAQTLEHFSLNKQQTLAFTIVAYTVQHHERDKLRMFLSGMAGTGKSEVLKALMFFMAARNESNRLLVLAPTGSSAANVNGSTYHSALCFGRDHEDISTMDENKLARLRGNLQDCDILFIDEISMISCLSWYLICAYLTVAFGDPLVSFGGKHVIVAGDFGQLPPPGPGHLALYSDSVGSWSSSLSLSTLR